MKILWPLTCAGLLLAAGCASGPADPPAQTAVLAVELRQEFELQMGQTARVSGTDLRLTLRAVPEDSRCPIEAVCVWQGNARVVLEARQGEGGQPETVSLNTGVTPDEVVLHGVAVKLKGVLPAASVNRTIRQRDYSALLVVGG